MRGIKTARCSSSLVYAPKSAHMLGSSALMQTKWIGEEKAPQYFARMTDLVACQPTVSLNEAFGVYIDNFRNNAAVEAFEKQASAIQGTVVVEVDGESLVDLCSIPIL